MNYTIERLIKTIVQSGDFGKKEIDLLRRKALEYWDDPDVVLVEYR